MKVRFLSFLFLILALASIAVGNVSAQGLEYLPSGISYADIGQEIEDYVAENQATTAGLALAVFDAKGPIYKNYFGYADIGAELPVTEETVFEWGSVTKLLVWVSVMQLEEQGLVDLHTDIKNYLPDNFLTNLKYDDEISLQDLMNHTPGFQEKIVNLFISPDIEPKSLAAALQDFPPVQIYRPGEIHAYSNWGAALAGYIVETVSGKPFHQYVHDAIFEPLGMKNTALASDLSDNPAVRDARIELHCYTASRRLIAECRHQIPLYPAGMATGTLNDFLAFASALVQDSKLGSPLFKEAETLEKLYQPSSYFGDSGVGINSHGFWTGFYKVRTLGHGGNTAGCSSVLQFDPISGIGVVVMTNQSAEKIYNAEMMPLIFGKFEDSDLAGYNTEIPAGFFRPARTTIDGPFALLSSNLVTMEESDLKTFWVLEQKNGKERVIYTINDLIRVETWELIVIFVLLGGMILGALYALWTLIGDGVIGSILRYRKQKKSGEVFPKDLPRRWRLLASGLQILTVLNLVVLIVQAMTFQRLENILWQFILFGILGIALLLLLALYLGKVRQHEQSKRKWLSHLSFVFISVTILNVLYWQLYRFWAI